MPFCKRFLCWIFSYLTDRRHFVQIDLSISKRLFTWDPEWNLPETKFQPTIKQILFTLLFIAGKMKWISFRGWSEINGSLSKVQSILFKHVQIFTFIWFRVVFTCYFITRNEILFLSKWPQWNNTRNEFHFEMYHVYKRLTRHRNENVSFRPKWNLM